MEKKEIYTNISILNDTNFHGNIKQRTTAELGKEVGSGTQLGGLCDEEMPLPQVNLSWKKPRSNPMKAQC